MCATAVLALDVTRAGLDWARAEPGMPRGTRGAPILGGALKERLRLSSAMSRKTLTCHIRKVRAEEHDGTFGRVSAMLCRRAMLLVMTCVPGVTRLLPISFGSRLRRCDRQRCYRQRCAPTRTRGRWYVASMQRTTAGVAVRICGRASPFAREASSCRG